MCAKQGYRHGIQGRISREFFNKYNRARAVVENHQQGQRWVEGMRVRKGCRLHGHSTCTGAAVDFVCAHQEPDAVLCMSRTARRRWL